MTSYILTKKELNRLLKIAHWAATKNPEVKYNLPLRVRLPSPELIVGYLKGGDVFEVGKLKIGREQD